MSILFNTLFTKENITFILAIIGSLGKIAGWIFHGISSIKNISLNVPGYNWTPRGMVNYIHIINNSKLPIIVYDVVVKISDMEYHCDEIPVKILSKTNRINNEIVSHNDFYSIPMPLTLHPQYGYSGYLNFVFEPENLQPAPKTLDFLVYTNRGMIEKKQLPLNKALV